MSKDDKIKIFAKMFSDSIISYRDKDMKRIKEEWDYEIVDKTMCPNYILLYYSWLFSRAMQKVKPENWKELLDKTHYYLWDSGSNLTIDEFNKLAKKLYPEFTTALEDRLSGNCVFPEVGATLCRLCFGEEYTGIDAAMFYDQVTFMQLETQIDMIKEIIHLDAFD